MATKVVLFASLEPMWQALVHYSLHFLAPLGLAYLFFRKNWRLAYLIMLLSMLVDLDHLLAEPLFKADRCSISFHPLHSAPAITLYCLLLAVPKFRLRALASGLLFHMFTDTLDCFWSESW